MVQPSAYRGVRSMPPEEEETTIMWKFVGVTVWLMAFLSGVSLAGGF